MSPAPRGETGGMQAVAFEARKLSEAWLDDDLVTRYEAPVQPDAERERRPVG